MNAENEQKQFPKLKKNWIRSKIKKRKIKKNYKRNNLYLLIPIKFGGSFGISSIVPSMNVWTFSNFMAANRKLQSTYQKHEKLKNEMIVDWEEPQKIAYLRVLVVVLFR